MANGILVNDVCYADVKTGLYHFYDQLTSVTWQGANNVLTGKQLNSVSVPNSNISANFWLSNYSYQQNQILTPSTCDPDVYAGSVLLLADSADLGGGGGAVDYDIELAAQFFGFAFVFVLSVYLVAKNVGVIISAVKKF